jgi:hypothetical protein
MTPKSVSRDRLIAWAAACQDFGYAITPPLTSLTLATLVEGEVVLRAVKTLSTPDGGIACSLSVTEQWIEGEDLEGDHRLESGGCHLLLASWHLQVGPGSAADGAERLDVVPDADVIHPRIHRHPIGWANHVRLPSELPPPQSWLHTADVLVEMLLTREPQEDVQD